MRNIYLIVPAVLGLSLYLVSRNEQGSARTTPKADQVVSQSTAPLTEKSAGPGLGNQVKSQAEQNRVTPLTSPAAEPLETQHESFSHPKLTRFADLNSKALLTPAEEAERKQLIQSRELVKSLAKAVSPRVRPSDQFEALDLLLEALDGQARNEAAKILNQVVRDQSVEDASLPVQLRKDAAGLKAEVLYKWLAQEPAIESTLQNSLPGPVSRQIWENVLRQQENNLKESEQLDRQARL